MTCSFSNKFKKSPPKVPYKAIALAVFLFLIGSLLIIFGALLLTGTIEVEVRFLYNLYIFVTKFRKFVNHLRSPSHRPNLIGKICDFSC